MSQNVPDDSFPTESEIECPRCGEVFYYDLNRCPNCGLDVYDPDEDEGDPGYDADPDWGVSPGRDTLEELLAMFTPAAAIFAGLFFSFVVATALFLVLRGFFGELVASGPGRAVPLLGVPVGAAAGSYAAAAMEAENPRRMGWWVGGLSVIAAIVLAGVGRDLLRETWIAVDTIPIWALTVLSGAAAGEFYRRRQRDEVVRQLFPEFAPEESLYAELLALTGHDPERVERLIEHERYFMPNANRRTLIEGAIQRLARDRR